MSKNQKIAAASLLAVLVIALVPLFALKGAEFGGSDDAGSQMVETIRGGGYEPWFTPVLEQLIGGELPGEVESLFFCLQTGIRIDINRIDKGLATLGQHQGHQTGAGTDVKDVSSLLGGCPCS